MRGEDRHRRNTQSPAAAGLPRQRARQVAEGAAGGGSEMVAGSRQRDAARPALEQFFAERTLETGDAVADRRGGDVQQFGRRLERARARRKLEGLQREQVARREGGGSVFRQNASAGRAIRVEAPALIW
jgi:hypothetical protein